MTTIIAGVDDSARSRDAVALAASLARAAGAELMLATAYPFDAVRARGANPELDRLVRLAAMESLKRHRDAVAGVDVTIRALPGASPALHLQELAKREHAVLIVIGSSHRGAIGRVFAGTTAERLLHGSPCPVAVAPKGYADAPGAGVRTIEVGYDGSPEARNALASALAAARAVSAAVRVVRVLEPPQASPVAAMGGVGLLVSPAEIERDARREFQADLEAIEGAGGVSADFVIGDPVDELAGRSHAADLLVVGSRGRGPHRAALLGSVSGRLVREAACPVMVIPRGVEAHLGEILGATATGQPA